MSKTTEPGAPSQPKPPAGRVNEPGSSAGAVKTSTGALANDEQDRSVDPRQTTSTGGAHLPHERDQALGGVQHEPTGVIEQAKRDLDAGQVDTDMRATPGLDAQRRDKLVGETRPDTKRETAAAQHDAPRDGKTRSKPDTTG